MSTSKHTQDVSCWTNNLRPTASRLVRSPILVSSDGLHRAYVEVEATAFKPENPATYTGPLCENTSRLYLAGPGGTTFGLAYSQSPDFSSGNSLRLVDWSPDGTLLLMERAQWTYESEGIYTDFLLFSPDSKAVTAPDLSAILSARFGKDCGSENSVAGFTANGKVVIAVGPLTEVIALMNGAKSCVRRKTLLALDPKSDAPSNAETLATDFDIAHFGRFLKSPVSK